MSPYHCTGWDQTPDIQNRSKKQTKISLKKKGGSSQFLQAGGCARIVPFMRFVQLCLYTGKQGQCLKVVAGLLPRPHPTPPLPGLLTALWSGRQAQGRPCGRGRLGPGDHLRLPDTEMSANGNHLSPLFPSFLSSLISSQSSPAEHTAGFF